MYSHSEVKRLQNVLRPFCESGYISWELTDEVVRLLKEQLQNRNGEKAQTENRCPRLLTRSETARILHCCSRTIDRLRMAGRIRAVHYGTRSIYFRETDILSLVVTEE